MHSSLVVGTPLHHPATNETLDEAFVEGDEFKKSFDENNSVAVFGCERCETVFWIPPAGCITHHPAVISFYYDHGLDIRSTLFLDARFISAKGGCTVASAAPVRVRIETMLDDETLCVTLDGEASVIDVEMK